jgi:hypothetical protein
MRVDAVVVVVLNQTPNEKGVVPSKLKLAWSPMVTYLVDPNVRLYVLSDVVAKLNLGEVCNLEAKDIPVAVPELALGPRSTKVVPVKSSPMGHQPIRLEPRPE